MPGHTHRYYFLWSSHLRRWSWRRGRDFYRSCLREKHKTGCCQGHGTIFNSLRFCGGDKRGNRAPRFVRSHARMTPAGLVKLTRRSDENFQPQAAPSSVFTHRGRCGNIWDVQYWVQSIGAVNCFINLNTSVVTFGGNNNCVLVPGGSIKETKLTHFLPIVVSLSSCAF